MTYSTCLALLLTTLASAKRPDQPDNDPALPPLQDHLQPTLQGILDLAEQFRASGPSPEATAVFEQQLQLRLRELGRRVVQHTYNSLEPADVQALPKHLSFETTTYTRLNKKTRQNVWTLFGQVSLHRIGYRSTYKNGDPTFFPLANSLGLLEGASPALACHAAQILAGAGMTQALARQRLRQECAVGWGVKKLRQFTAATSQRLGEQRHECQVQRLLDLLGQAEAQRGKNPPVLSVGRDGITLRLRARKRSKFEVATTATVSVHDGKPGKQGKRLGTVYLAYRPQKRQATMTGELTRLVEEVLRRWEGPLPRLCYVSDAGKSESSYYRQVLARLRHPRTGEKLRWVRVVDYYHASQRLWTMAESLFGKGRQTSGWVRKMQRWLLKPGGINRVLHSAAAYRARVELSGKKGRKYQKAYKYLRKRMKYLRYEEYRRQGMPVGSGVTEAACKTVFTQRLKLSGMRWGKEGAQRILDLRVLLLSGVWEQAFNLTLRSFKEAQLSAREVLRAETPVNAA